ncbi:MAG TPA: histone deacetylase [Burkholderiaceae bacterium]|nr:histone deacetylase [Burkholderiaceae bacterium]
MKAFYSDRYVLPLPGGHRFPMAKYRLLREQVERAFADVVLSEPEPASFGQLSLAHAPEYIERVIDGRLDATELRSIGFPWSEAMVERSRRSVGATIAACRAALCDGVAVNLAGGTHHAQSGRGAGYCVFNDAAIAARVMQAEAANGRRVLRVAIVDLDVHQGDGTAQILQGDPSVFTLSMHAASNFPFRKQASCLDVALPDGARDEAYLSALVDALSQLRRCFDPQLIIYLAGADAHEGDRLGRLKLSAGGMRARDERVFEFAEGSGVPIAVAMGGGYGREISTTVEVHFATVESARKSWLRRKARTRAANGAGAPGHQRKA